MGWASPQLAITTKNIMVFIDGSNFLAGYCEYQKEKNKKLIIDYPCLKRELLMKARGDKRHILFEHIKTYYYTSEGIPQKVKSGQGLDISSDDIKIFKESLKQNHVKIISKPKINGKEKGVDVALAVDLLAMAYSNAYDYVIIVSGDADFINAIEEVKRFGKIVYIASFKSRFSQELLMHVDGVFFLDSMAGTFLNEPNKNI